MPQLSPSNLLSLRILSALFLWPTLIVVSNSLVLKRFTSIPALPSWVVVIACLLSVPFRIWLKIARERWEAYRLGAGLPPRLGGKWIGDVDLMMKLLEIFRKGYFGDGLWEAIDDFGSVFEVFILWDHNIVTCNPEYIKKILATDFNEYEKGTIFRQTMYSVLGTGVFNSDGEMWKFHRAMTRPFFNRDRITHFEMFDRHADEAIKKMKERFRAGYAVDFQDVISRFTLDSATEFLFGSCVHSLSSDLPYPYFVVSSPSDTKGKDSTQADDFARAFTEAQVAVAWRTRQGYIWPFIEFFKDRTAEPMKVVNAYIDPILKEAIEKAKAAPWEDNKDSTDVEEDDTLLDHLVKYTKDPVVLHDEILNIMIAGRDTTAASLTFAVYFLCMYPHVLERLRKEILETVGATRRPTYDDIRQMKYLRAVINETLRLYPVVPINVRYNVEATTWPNLDPNGKPFYIPAYTSCAYSVFMMHRRKEYWGPDAEEFDPDRFLDERLGKYLTPNPFIFLPFNAGPRICLGQQFAYNEMSFFLIRLLQNFSTMELDLTAQPPDTRPPAEWAEAVGRRKSIEKFFPKCHLTMYSEGGLWVRMTETSGDTA